MTATQLKEIMNELNMKDITYKIVDGYNNSYVEISQEINGINTEFIISFPIGFPYQFPEIRVKGEEYKNLPHIDKKTGKLCLFNQEAIPNPKMPIEVINESINKARNIIYDGLNGFNKEDFIDEFHAYWISDEDTLGNIDVFFEPLNEVKRVKCIYSKDYSFWCCGDNYNELIEYTKKNCQEELVVEDAIYIPMSEKIYPPFPHTNKEFYNILSKSENGREYKKFLTNRKGNPIVLFSQEDKGRYILSCIIHTGIYDIKKGFRKGKIAPDVAYRIVYPDNKVLKFTTEIINRKRLFYRGGDGNMIDKKVSILGCGSLGGYLAQALTELGVNDIKLVDDENLRKENIARHICGIDFVDMNKTEAIKRKLTSHYIGLKIETYSNNIYSLITNNIEELSDRDIQFVAVGDMALESYIIDKYNKGELKGKIVIVWVEPYAIGGHAIILNKPQDNIEQCIYSDNWQLKNRILEKPEIFTKKEAGCQSTFVQYSGFEANYFIRTLLDNIINGKLLNDKNYFITIAGKIDWARENQIEITSKWLSAKNRTVNIEEL